MRLRSIRRLINSLYSTKNNFRSGAPKIENAKAPDPGTVGVSFALKFEHDESHLTLDFEEEINETYIKDN